MFDRRTFLAGFALLCLLAGPRWAFAKDGDSGGGDGGGGDSDSDSGGGDDSGGDERDESDESDESSGRGRGRGRGGGDDDADRIREAVRQGDAERLSDILLNVRRTFRGKVVRIRMKGQDRNLQYRIRILGPDRKLIEVRVKASNGRIMSVEGL
jgi:uncharacterized membrane protein YkoI